jgi:GxxExxY protein
MEWIYKEESFKIIGICMEVHRELGLGYSEIIYKDALEIEFKRHNIPYIREKEFRAFYKGLPLSRTFNVDFWVYESIILEVKAKSGIIEEHEMQTLNYIACAKMHLGIVANFGAKSFQQKRIVL